MFFFKFEHSILCKYFGVTSLNIAFRNLKKHIPVQNFILRRLALFPASESQYMSSPRQNTSRYKKSSFKTLKNEMLIIAAEIRGFWHFENWFDFLRASSDVFEREKLKKRVSERGKRRTDPEFHSASIRVILSFWFAILELTTPKFFCLWF